MGRGTLQHPEDADTPVAGRVLTVRETVIVYHPVTRNPTPIQAGQPVPDWARDLIPADLLN